jgi:hypothetical protein
MKNEKNEHAKFAADLSINGLDVKEDGTEKIKTEVFERPALAGAPAHDYGGIDVDGNPRTVPAGALYRVKAHGDDATRAQQAFFPPGVDGKHKGLTHVEAVAACQAANKDAEGTGTWFGVVGVDEP